jgi:outer membrane protein
MKYRIPIFFFISLIFATGGTFGQTRIAYIDAQKILKRMPEAVDAETRLDQFVAQWNKEITDMETELKRKREDYDRKKLIMTDAERNAVELDFTDLIKRIDQSRQEKYGTNGELYKQQADLMKQAYDKLNRAIEEVALDGRYDYVFDRGANDHAILYTNAKYDLTAAVAKKLGLETNDIFNVPLVNSPNKTGKPNTTNNPNQGLPPNVSPPPGSMPPGTIYPPGVTPPIKHQ